MKRVFSCFLLLVFGSLVLAATPVKGRKPGPTPTAAKPKSVVPVISVPAEIDLSTVPTMSSGDTWSYLVSSADPTLDLSVVTVTLKQRGEKTLAFEVRSRDGEARPVEVPTSDGTWFAPIESEPGAFGIRAIGKEHPDKVSSGVTWSSSQRFFKYDAAGNRTGEEGYLLSGTGPHICAVPAGAYPCVQITRNDLGKSGIQSWIGIARETPAAVWSRVRRPSGEGMLLFELLPPGAPPSDGAPPLDASIPSAERGKAIDWIKQNNKWGENADIVENVIFILQEGIRTYPNAGIRMTAGSDVTKDGRTYQLDWRKQKFSVKALSPQEAKNAPTGLTRSAVP